jgi:hypothetical protein
MKKLSLMKDNQSLSVIDNEGEIINLYLNKPKLGDVYYYNNNWFWVSDIIKNDMIIVVEEVTHNAPNKVIIKWVKEYNKRLLNNKINKYKASNKAFGKWKHKTWLEVLSLDPGYILWLIRVTEDDNLKTFLLDLIKLKSVKE